MGNAPRRVGLWNLERSWASQPAETPTDKKARRCKQSTGRRVNVACRSKKDTWKNSREDSTHHFTRDYPITHPDCKHPTDHHAYRNRRARPFASLSAFRSKQNAADDDSDQAKNDGSEKSAGRRLAVCRADFCLRNLALSNCEPDQYAEPNTAGDQRETELAGVHPTY
jgi:hypothetical protein